MNSFNLILDTTPPNITIALPPYVIVGSFATIYIYGDEEIAYNSLYIMDSYGNRHDLTAEKLTNALKLQTNFSFMPSGTATLHCQITDIVGNIVFKEKTFDVIQSVRAFVKMKLYKRKIDTDVIKPKIKTRIKHMRIVGGVKNADIQ